MNMLILWVTYKFKICLGACILFVRHVASVAVFSAHSTKELWHKVLLYFCSVIDIITSRKFVFYGPFAVPFLSHSSNTFLNSFSFSSTKEGGTMIIKCVTQEHKALPPGQGHTNHVNTSSPRKTDNTHNYD